MCLSLKGCSYFISKFVTYNILVSKGNTANKKGWMYGMMWICIVRLKETSVNGTSGLSGSQGNT